MVRPDDSDGALADPEARGLVAAVDLLVEARQLVAGAQDALDRARWLLDDGPAAPIPARPVPSPPASSAPAPHRPVAGMRRWATIGAAVAGITLLSAGAFGIAHDLNQRAAAGLAVSTSPQPDASQSTTPSTVPAVVTRSGRAVPPAVSDGVPTSLRISRLGVRASVSGPVSVEPSGPEAGLLTAPDDYLQLGWYRRASAGALVLDGHVGYRSNPGPLAFIGELRQGDRIVVEFPGGTQSYAVTVVASVVKGQLPQQYFTAPYNASLMLITCDYQSAFRAGHFADNLYVVAAPVS